MLCTLVNELSDWISNDKSIVDISISNDNFDELSPSEQNCIIYSLLILILVLILSLCFSKHFNFTRRNVLFIFCLAIYVLPVFKLNMNMVTHNDDVPEHIIDFNGLNSKLLYIDAYKFSFTGVTFSPFL